MDPLDGTTNFAHGVPLFNVTLGLEKAGEMVAGVIFDPVQNEMFSTERGSGSFLNGRRIRVSGAACVADALVATGFPSRRRHLTRQRAPRPDGARKDDLPLLGQLLPPRKHTAYRDQRRAGHVPCIVLVRLAHINHMGAFAQ